MTKPDPEDIGFALGFILIGAGVGLMHVPTALIVMGILFMAISVIVAWGKK